VLTDPSIKELVLKHFPILVPRLGYISEDRTRFYVPQLNKEFKVEKQVNDAVMLKMGEDDYFAATDYFNSSSVKSITKSFKAFTYTLKNKSEPSTSMELGTAFHHTMDGSFNDKYYVGELADGRTAVGKAQREEIALRGLKVLTNAQSKALEQMKITAANNPILQQFGNFQSEHTKHETVIMFLWNGLPCKAMIDVYNPNWTCFLDFKTTKSCSDLRAVSNTVQQYGYYIQAAFYQEALSKLTNFVFDPVYIFVENTPPYGIRIVKITEDYLEFGRTNIIHALEKYRYFLDNKEAFMNDTIFDDYSLKIDDIDMPYWLKNEITYGENELLNSAADFDEEV
jgi:hypothetical protein